MEARALLMARTPNSNKLQLTTSNYLGHRQGTTDVTRAKPAVPLSSLALRGLQFARLPDQDHQQQRPKSQGTPHHRHLPKRGPTRKYQHVLISPNETGLTPAHNSTQDSNGLEPMHTSGSVHAWG